MPAGGLGKLPLGCNTADDVLPGRARREPDLAVVAMVDQVRVRLREIRTDRAVPRLQMLTMDERLAGTSVCTFADRAAVTPDTGATTHPADDWLVVSSWSTLTWAQFSDMPRPPALHRRPAATADSDTAYAAAVVVGVSVTQAPLTQWVWCNRPSVPRK